MEPVDVYLMYCALKAHFGKGKYNYHQYGGKTKIKRESFYKRKDRYFFTKLATTYKTKQEIENYLLANFIKERRGYIGRISLETLIILDELVEYTQEWNIKLKGDVVWEPLKELMKNYKGFLTIDAKRYRIKLLNLIEESS